MPRLTLTTESGSTHSVDLENLRYTIGRAGDCEVQVQDLSLSSHHARLERRQDGWHLTDLDSTNGTKINGVRLFGEQLLRHDDAVAFGDVSGFFTDLSDVTRTREMPGVRQPAAPAAVADEDAALTGAAAPSRDAALAWRLVTLLAIADFALAVALAVALLLLWSSGNDDKTVVEEPTVQAGS